MIRVSAFKSLGGFKEDLIAGEAPALCVRLRAAKWRIWRLDDDMAYHDANIFHFRQLWRRALRSGYAYAQGAYLHGATDEKIRIWETRRAWLWGAFLPTAGILASLIFPPWGLVVWLVFPLQMFRQTLRGSGSLHGRTTVAFFKVVSRFPEALSQLKFWPDRLFQRRSLIIVY